VVDLDDIQVDRLLAHVGGDGGLGGGGLWGLAADAAEPAHGDVVSGVENGRKVKEEREWGKKVEASRRG
jgi:hypothetical protein